MTRRNIIVIVVFVLAVAVTWLFIDDINKKKPPTNSQITSLLNAPPTHCRSSNTDLYALGGKVRIDYMGDNNVLLHLIFDASGGQVWAEGGSTIQAVANDQLYKFGTNAIFSVFEDGNCSAWSNPDNRLFRVPAGLTSAPNN